MVNAAFSANLVLETSMLTSIAYAAGSSGAAAPGGAGGAFASLVPLLLMFAVFYFLLIRPQQKRNKEHKAMLASLGKGTHIVTVGGLLGRIVDIEGDILTVDLGNTQVRMTRGAIGSIFDPKAAAEKPADDKAAEKKK